jgi:hypothetical protein
MKEKNQNVRFLDSFQNLRDSVENFVFDKNIQNPLLLHESVTDLYSVSIFLLVRSIRR